MIALRSLTAMLSLLALVACASLPPQGDRAPAHALTDTADTRLGIAFAPLAKAHPGQDAFHLLRNPVDALDARVLLADRADRSLDLQYYIWHDDLTGHTLADAVMRAADRGVRVRVLLDDLGTNADDRKLLEISAHPHIEIRLFNPVAARTFKKIGAALEFSRVNRRMHNKAMIADNQAAIVGGRNIGDEYFGASSMLEFGDLDVVVHGPVVTDISTEFDAFWNSPYAYPIDALVGHEAAPGGLDRERERLRDYMRAMEDNPYVLEARQRLDQIVHGQGTEWSWGRATVLYDDPAKIAHAPNDSEGHLMPKLRALALQPEHELLIVSPYFVPGKDMIERLRALIARGVRVTVLTNSLASTDVAAVHAGYRRYRRDLVEAGVRLYERRPSGDKSISKQVVFGSSRASLHAKTYVFDRKGIFIGSMNLDPRSLKLNTEIGVYCENPEIASGVAADLESRLDAIAWRVVATTDPAGHRQLEWIQTHADGTTTRLDTEPEVSAARRMQIWLLGLLPIESQL
ncbi:phospholipase D family protein [Burkholderia stagnalis]|uniref:phospholipase D family protein n=1 Tax=Burkholderia stagnalis TaxID=1503054 RepID=UPI00075C3B53|nr:phospholipase D family protein [Burkholderia stagnalis]KVO56979.1 phospholipase [Burkholderia stagnalis]KVP11260.1 phospholipase [Burkholderia stagnalis]KVW92499.1 phospholipase [Burkholderia stagnalis]KWH72494.1 phospholipase [Burkholderia stagnalis]